MWPLMHIAYLVLNGFWFWFFFINYSEAPNVDLRLLKDNQKINTTIMLFALGFLSLKMASDVNCRIWKVSWSDCLAIISQVMIECLFINIFYEWYKDKVGVLKYGLAENLDNMI